MSNEKQMKEKKEKLTKATSEEETPETASNLRHILIETNGSDIRIVKSEAASKLEFIAILETVLSYVRNN